MIVIEAQDVSKQFLLRHNASVELKVRFLSLLHKRHRESIEEFWAVRNVSLRIEQGEAVGLVGRNGSGKSTLLKLIAAVHRPSGGRMLVRRGIRVSSMIELAVGFHPELTGRENVFLNAAIHGLSRGAIESIYDAVVDYSGLAHFIDVPIKNYSSGMFMRLGFAIAANMDPDVLLLDEIFAVGDADFQRRCIATVNRFIEAGKTIIFVSHSPGAIRQVCRRVCVLDAGRLTFDGGLDEGLAFYEGQFAPAPAPAIALSGADAHVAALMAADECGAWALRFLRQQGLAPDVRVLDVSGEGYPAGAHLMPVLAEGYYVPLAREELAMHGMPNTFDVVWADLLFFALPFNDVARTIAAAVKTLAPTGCLFASWYENPEPSNFDPIVRSPGLTTFPDRMPYHYPLTLVAEVCRALDVHVERVDGPAHPRGASVLRFTRRQ